MKIVVTDARNISKTDEYFEPLKKLGDLCIYELSDETNLAERIKDADIVVANKNVFNEAVLEKAENLKYIGLFATGYNNVDIEYCSRRKIAVCNAGSYSTDAVAQHTFALILNCYNEITRYDELVKNEEWIKCKTFSNFIYNMHELGGKTIGLIGYGSIARKVAKIAKAFDMEVIAYKRNTDGSEDVKCVSLSEVLEKSDIVSVHCPLNRESEKMFNREAFAKMKKNAIFINTARGGIVDEEALCEALNNDIIAAAAVDVIAREPMQKNCILLNAKNITITPHVAWGPDETRQRLLGIVKSNIEAFMAGKPKNMVNNF